MEISDEQIKFAENILIDGNKFDVTRREFIRCLDKSVDLVACPGSGKTTALLAKLIVLAEHMPFEDGSGICVLTHTNVAIDEIKKKLGAKSHILFSHPNFFGTIQSFVDKFLLIPYWINKNGVRPDRIDDESYKKSMLKRIHWKYFVSKNDNFDIRKKALHYINVHTDFLFEFRLKKIENEYQICSSANDKIIEFKKPNPQKSQSWIDWNPEEKEHVKKWFKTYKYKTHSIDSVFSYDDAYLFGNIYLEDHPKILNYFLNRFKYVFIDEMQDTDIHQKNIIDNLFPFESSKIIVQRIGDPNQAIYNDSSETDTNGWQPILNFDTTLLFSKSLRFGNEIASRIKFICRNDISTSLIGNEHKQSQIPHIILFDKSRKEEVIEKFTEIINSYGINPDKNKKFKAIGRVGKERTDDKMTIKSYYPNFNSKKESGKIDFDNLISYLRKQKDDLVCKNGVKCYSDIFISLFLQVLSIAEVKYSTISKEINFTKSTLYKFIIDKDESFQFKFNSNIAKWAKDLNINVSFDLSIYGEIETYLKSYFVPFFEIDYSKIKTFVENRVAEFPVINASETNVYTSIGLPNLKVYIDTIHGVKGETHKATLYLDTYFHEYDSTHFREHFSVHYINNNCKQKRKKKALKLAHVAMSRPTDLLCVAIDIENISNEILTSIEYNINIKPNGWIINRDLLTSI